MEIVPDRSGGAGQICRLHQGPRSDAQSDPQPPRAVDTGRLQRPAARPVDTRPRPARPPARYTLQARQDRLAAARPRAIEGTLRRTKADPEFSGGLTISMRVWGDDEHTKILDRDCCRPYGVRPVRRQ